MRCRRVPTHLNSSPVLLSDLNVLQIVLCFQREAKFDIFRQVLVSCQLSASSHDPFNTPKRAIEISSYEEMKHGPTCFSCSPYCSHLQQQTKNSSK